MRKNLLSFSVAAFALLAIAVSFSSCGKKPAEQSSEAQEQQDQMVDDQINEQVVNDQMVNYIDIVGLTPAGGELSLSSLVGQTDFVLIDFWASWCGPCRRFVPVLKEIYAGQPEGHLQILSCSVDQDVMAWQVALNEEQMPWPQMREDADHMCSDKYGVQFIPHTVLIDKSGKIVAVNPEEPELEELLFGE